MKEPASVTELFSRYLQFLKGSGIEELLLSEKSLEFIQETSLRLPKPRKETAGRAPSVIPFPNFIRLVSWKGNPVSRLLCVAENLSSEEEQQSASQKLTDIIEKGLKLKTPDVVICEIGRCTDEPEKFKEHVLELREKIVRMNPLAILSMGDMASSFLLRRRVISSSERGRWGEFEGTRVMPTLHPGYIVKNYTREVRRDVFDDIKKVMGELGKK